MKTTFIPVELKVASWLLWLPVSNLDQSKRCLNLLFHILDFVYYLLYFFFLLGAKSTSGIEGVPFKAAQIMIHPKYLHNPRSIGPFDIALIRLAGMVTNTPFACLPAPGTPVPNGLCAVAGRL